MNTEKFVTLAIIVLSIAVAVGRFTIPGHGLTGWPGFYEAMAHIFVGALIVLAISGDNKWLSRVALGLLIVLEVVAFMGVAHAADAAPAIPSIAQAQSALTGLQTAYVDLVGAWHAVQPVLSFIGGCAAFAATLPKASAGSWWQFPRALLDIAGANVGNAKNAPKV